MKVDLGGVQALVTSPYRRPTSHHLFFRFDDGAGARACLGELAQSGTMADVTLDTAPDPLLNVGVTYNGLSALGVDPALPCHFGHTRGLHTARSGQRCNGQEPARLRAHEGFGVLLHPGKATLTALSNPAGSVTR